MNAELTRTTLLYPFYWFYRVVSYGSTSLVCRLSGHANLHDMQVLLDRNGLWTADVKAYLYQSVDRCHLCKKTEEPKDIRKVSLHGLSSLFNDRGCIDHLFLDNNVELHFMDSSTRLSHGAIVATTTMHEAIELFDMIWVSQYGYPNLLSQIRSL